jgi:hypothetical protein
MLDRHKTSGYQWPSFEGDALADTLWDTLPKNGIFHRGIESFRVSQVIYLLLKSSEVIEGQTAAYRGSL